MLDIGEPMVLYPIAVEDMQFPFIDMVVIGIPVVDNMFVPNDALCGEHEFIVDIDIGIEFIEYVGVIGDMELAVEAIVVESVYSLLDNISVVFSFGYSVIVALQHIYTFLVCC